VNVLLGLDLGTGSIKALLLEPDGTVIGEGSSAYPVNAPHPGWAETNPNDWWNAAQDATRKALGARGHEVTAIGLSGQMHGVVLCNVIGTPLRDAILWADTRSHDELEAYRTLGPELLKKLGNPLAVGMAGVSLLWLKRHELETYNAARHALQPKDWLRLKLTHEVAAEPSDASGTLLYDLGADGWAWDVLERLGLRSDLLAPIIPSGGVAGALSSEAATHLGLREGVPVTAGAADAAAAMLGSGLLEAGAVQLTVGSGAQIVAPRDHVHLLANPRTHLYRAAAPERWYAMAAMQNAGIALEWVRGVLGLSWAEAYMEAFSVPVGCEGLSFLPYLTGERTPHLDPHARGVWAGLGLHHARGHLMRSALEGLAFSLKDGLSALETTGVQANELRLAGGGTLDPRWRQLLADVLERPLLASEISSASARGAALLGGIASGAFRDAQDTLRLAPKPVLVAEPGANTDALHEAYERFRALYPRVRGWS
jgi:xylulokinase